MKEKKILIFPEFKGKEFHKYYLHFYQSKIANLRNNATLYI